MKANEVPEYQIERLAYLVKNYNGLTKLLVQIKNRLKSKNSNPDPKHDDLCIGLESLKDKEKRKIEKELDYWDIWNLWLEKILGIGPWLAGEMILKFYYRFIPICKKCGEDLEKIEKAFYCNKCEKSVKGDGTLLHRIDYRRWKSISAWHKFMGRGLLEDGKLPRMKKGEKCDYDPKNRAISYHIGEQFVKQNNGHLYRAYYDARKSRRLLTHPEATPLYRHRMARNEMIRLFLSHFMIVVYEIEGLDIPQPYIIDKGGHTGYISPYYWESSES